MRSMAIASILAAGCLVPHALSAAEARPADVAVPPGAPAASRLVTALELELPYAEGEEGLGFVPAGSEHPAFGANAIAVSGDGTILLSDPVRNKLFAVRVDASGRPAISVAGTLPPRPVARSGGVPTGTRAVKTSGEGGEIVFVDGGIETRVGLSAGGPLASLRLVGVDRLGRAFVVMERFCELGRTAVDRELLVVERSGALVARAALPAPPLVPPLTELYLTPDGALYLLAAGAESVRVVRLEVRP